MFYLVAFGFSVGVLFHRYRGWGRHVLEFDGVRRRAVELGAVTLDVVRAL